MLDRKIISRNVNLTNQVLRFIFFVTVFYSFCSLATGQGFSKANWYSESNTNGIVIQNSFPKGGPYKGPVKRHFNYSHLVFFTRVVNETDAPIEVTINFSADSIAIPFSPNTFVKLFLPPDTMTYDKQSMFDFGVTDLESLEKPTRFQRTLNPKEECLFYVVAIFYQTMADTENQQRGGNRAEFILQGQDLFYRMPPQVESISCGKIIYKR